MMHPPLASNKVFKLREENISGPRDSKQTNGMRMLMLIKCNILNLNQALLHPDLLS